jgi:hypothetical protein
VLVAELRGRDVQLSLLCVEPQHVAWARAGRLGRALLERYPTWWRASRGGAVLDRSALDRGSDRRGGGGMTDERFHAETASRWRAWLAEHAADGRGVSARDVEEGSGRPGA